MEQITLNIIEINGNKYSTLTTPTGLVCLYDGVTSSSKFLGYVWKTDKDDWLSSKQAGSWNTEHEALKTLVKNEDDQK